MPYGIVSYYVPDTHPEMSRVIFLNNKITKELEKWAFDEFKQVPNFT
jgi:hypothetical protein